MDRAATDDLNIRARLLEKHGRLACALSPPDHGDALAAESVKIVVFAGVAGERSRNIREGGGTEFLPGEAGGDDDALAMNSLAVRHDGAKSIAGRLDTLDHALIKIGTA